MRGGHSNTPSASQIWIKITWKLKLVAGKHDLPYNNPGSLAPVPLGWGWGWGEFVWSGFYCRVHYFLLGRQFLLCAVLPNIKYWISSYSHVFLTCYFLRFQVSWRSTGDQHVSDGHWYPIRLCCRPRSPHRSHKRPPSGSKIWNGPAVCVPVLSGGRCLVWFIW